MSCDEQKKLCSLYNHSMFVYDGIYNANLSVVSVLFLSHRQSKIIIPFIYIYWVINRKVTILLRILSCYFCITCVVEQD